MELKNSFKCVSLNRFMESLQVRLATPAEVSSKSGLQFEIYNIPACVSNSLRRALYSHVPTMKIEHCFYDKRSSVPVSIYTLVHRLGQVRIATNAALFQYEESDTDDIPWKVRFKPDFVLNSAHGPGLTARPLAPTIGQHYNSESDFPTAHQDTTLVFELNVSCRFNEQTMTLEHETVYSEDLKWKPVNPDQQAKLEAANAIPRIMPGLPVAVLNEGDSVHVTCYAVKGTAYEMGKWRACTSDMKKIDPDSRYKDPAYGGDYYWTMLPLDGGNIKDYLRLALDHCVTVWENLLLDLQQPHLICPRVLVDVCEPHPLLMDQYHKQGVYEDCNTFEAHGRHRFKIQNADWTIHGLLNLSLEEHEAVQMFRVSKFAEDVTVEIVLHPRVGNDMTPLDVLVHCVAVIFEYKKKIRSAFVVLI